MSDECFGVRLYQGPDGHWIKDTSPMKPLTAVGNFHIDDGEVSCTMMFRGQKCALLGDGLLATKCQKVNKVGGRE